MHVLLSVLSLDWIFIPQWLMGKTTQRWTEHSCVGRHSYPASEVRFIAACFQLYLTHLCLIGTLQREHRDASRRLQGILAGRATCNRRWWALISQACLRTSPRGPCGRGQGHICWSEPQSSHMTAGLRQTPGRRLAGELWVWCLHVLLNFISLMFEFDNVRTQIRL